MLPGGEYVIFPRRHTLQIAHPDALDYTSADETGRLDCTERSVVRMFHEANLAEDMLDQEFKRCIGITLSTTNRLVQWYRFHARHAQATQLVIEQVSPILIHQIRGKERETYVHRSHHLSPRPQSLANEELSQFNRNLLRQIGPPTEHLLLLDAEEALLAFRYRETVLLAWSAIETGMGPFLRSKLLESLPDLSFDRDSAGTNIEQDLHFLTHVDAMLQLLTGFSFRTGVTPTF